MMTDVVERSVGDLRIVIDRSKCVGFAQCVDVAEEAFQVQDDDIVDFAAPERVGRDRLIEAASACPIEALKVVEQDGKQLAP